MRSMMLLLVLLCPACATLVRGSTQAVHFTSSPPGALVTFGVYTGYTPCTLDVKRSRHPQLARFEMGNREPAQVTVVPSETVDATMLLHVIDSLTIVGGIVNLSTKCFWDFPSTINAQLEETSSGKRSQATANDP